ncbi:MULTISPECIES: hypothetical protein [Actinopolyspora]|uniref:hypothetical protein n=1 Tax=Actinopolyspora TaxID=1849 RepID=UPI001587AB9B|nr:MULTISPECIES: hypothetical protein [Actinopolyspora]
MKRPEVTFCHSVMQPGPPRNPALRHLKAVERDGRELVRQVNHREGQTWRSRRWRWRWTEQWPPHATWYLYAVSVGG